MRAERQSADKSVMRVGPPTPKRHEMAAPPQGRALLVAFLIAFAAVGVVAAAILIRNESYRWYGYAEWCQAVVVVFVYSLPTALALLGGRLMACWLAELPQRRWHNVCGRGTTPIPVAVEERRSKPKKSGAATRHTQISNGIRLIIAACIATVVIYFIRQYR